MVPVPVPRTFSGNPLEFIDFERSFKTLIENRGIPPKERLYYLKQYVTGPAKDAIEGFFFGATEEAYDSAWKTLQDRYGHPFKVQQAFRERLNKWPKISSKDAPALQKFADFLKSCNDAVPYVHGLQVLNDCLENQKLLNKLPDWIVARWNRMVTSSLEECGRYPTFADFATFVSKEARIANNPISSFGALRGNEVLERGDSKGKESVSRSKGSTFVTKGKEKSNKASWSPQDKAQGRSNGSAQAQFGVQGQSKENSAKKCSLCSATEHQLEGCPEFVAKSMADRKEFIRKNQICFGCLRKNHFSKDCRNRHKCEVCGKRHPTVLHEYRPEASNSSEGAHSQKPNEWEGSSQATATSCQVQFDDHASTSMIVPVWISTEEAPAAEMLTYALLDTQSDSSFILDDVARALNVKQQPVRLKLSTMTSSSTIESNIISNLVVRGMALPTKLKIGKAYTRDFIPADKQHIPTRATAEKWPHLQDVAGNIPTLQDCEVGLLLGFNCPQALVPREVVTGMELQPYAIRTDLGWSVVGSADPGAGKDWTSQCYRTATQEMPGLTPKDVLRTLEADFAERHHGEKTYSQQDIQFLNHLESNILQCEDGHLQMPLPFKCQPKLPNNRRLAAIRLQHLQRKMDRNETFKDHYLAFMSDIVNGGFAEHANDEAPAGAVNYIPHHGVYHSKKNKLRIVFDCSAKFAGTCLNDHLLKGPDLTNALSGVLMRFRKHEVAMLCDIEKMFFQFRVEECDRNFLRFLWWEGNDVQRAPVDYRMTVHLFGAASSPGCANYGLKYLANQYKEDYPDASRFLERNFYVDDGVVSVPSTKEAIKLAREARELCQKGGLRLHKFVSNDKAVTESLPESERACEVKHSNLDFEEPVERALGIMWNIAADVFFFKITLKEQPMTRRGILSTVASLYDPLGFVAPVILNGKRILQEMCRRGVGWDDTVPDTLKPAWEQWCKELPLLQELKIPRCHHPLNFGQPVLVQLHHFSDASMSGYGQCSYVRLLNREGKVHCTLIFAKSRVAPTKVVTVPRLELKAAVVSAKVGSMLRDELEYQEAQEFYWTDSQVVLGYINNEARKFHTFVANRVQQIRERTSPDQWHYVPTDQNPADYASRGLVADQLQDVRWFQGPSFLWEENIKVKDITCELKIGDPEVKAINLAARSNPEPLDLLQRLARISDWSMMVKVLARLKMVAKGNNRGSVVQERKDAEMFILQLTQRKAFHDELQSLTHGKTLKSINRIHDLDPYVDETGMLRVGGRLQRLPKSVAHPVILPKHSPITQAIVQHFHQKVQHQGRGMTQNEVRSSGYWIVNGSKVVTDLVRNCVMCRRLRRPEEEQKMANLPEDRTEPTPPFTNVGMDCFGPFTVKRGRSEIKRYGLIFTCFCSRGVHIEMLDDMSTDSFINALRCFIAIRGAVRQIRCDQGSNLVGARNELHAALNEMDSKKVETYLADQQCEFVFNAPHSSHAGGVWERQIRTIRSVLRATIDLCPGRLTDSALRTFLYEAMAIVNSRPLTMVNMNDPRADAPLSPNHLLTMKGKVPLPPPGQFPPVDMYTRKTWRRVQSLLEQFWSRWKREYLLSLQQRKKWTKPRRNLQVGDIVLMIDHETPRMQWPLAMVTSASPDDDGLVRQVQVRVGTKNLDRCGRPDKKLSELKRPIQKLVLLLECSPLAQIE